MFKQTNSEFILRVFSDFNKARNSLKKYKTRLKNATLITRVLDGNDILFDGKEGEFENLV